MMSVCRRLRCAHPMQWHFIRSLFSITGQWPQQLDSGVKSHLEIYWKDRLKQLHEEKSLSVCQPKKEKYYVLSMFPYPSGQLHMGHVRVYAISDTMARYHRLTGKHVIHPMGWDAFGLPAENAAIERGIAPDEWTKSNISNMKKQLEELGCSFDWNREYATCDPEYYKWTQYLFLKLYEAGLVYSREGAVNWDPVDQTVLADEQIDENGCSWRSGAKAEKRFLKQWYIRITAYSKALLEGLEEVDPDLWRDIIDLQRHWIGECDGVRIEMPIVHNSAQLESRLSMFTRTPECLYGASHILVSPEHQLNNKLYYKDPNEHFKSDAVELSVHAVHPLSQQPIPVFVSHTHDFGAFLDTHLAIPCLCAKDEEFAQQHKIPVTQVLTDQGVLQHSDMINGLCRSEAFKQISKVIQRLGYGGHVTSERGRDWLISRQRYWGTPIPIIHCPKYGAVPVPYEDLPVTLPRLDSLSGKGASPLAAAEDWLKAKCNKCDCGGYGQRETDTMDTFVDSSWYYLRYLDPHNPTEPCSQHQAHKYMPVDLYIGGKEHAIMHLYYARFIHHFLHSQGLVPCREPFVNLLTQGMVMGQSYRLRNSGKYIHRDQVNFSGKEPVEKGTGKPLEVQWEKMSKSKYNGVDPQAVLDEFGTDSTRLCILSNVAPKSDRHWSLDVFKGIERWQGRVWSLVGDLMTLRSKPGWRDTQPDVKVEEDIRQTRNYFLKEVSFHMKQTFLLNTALANLQGYSTALKKYSSGHTATSCEYERALSELVIMMSPFAPMFCSELWAGLASIPHVSNCFKWDKGVLEQQWPSVDIDYKPKMKIKIKNKEVYSVALPYTLCELEQLSKTEALSLAQQHPDYPQLELAAQTQPQAVTLHVRPNLRAELIYTAKGSKVSKKKLLKKK